LRNRTIQQKNAFPALNKNLKKPLQPLTSNIENEPKKTTAFKNSTVSQKQANGNGICYTLTSRIKKAYTIAGTVPGIVLKNTKKESYESSYNKNNNNISMNNDVSMQEKMNTSSSIYENEEVNYSNINSNNYPTELVNENPNKTSCGTVFQDILVLFFVVVLFMSNLANLLNDSGYWYDSNEGFANYDNSFSWFQTLLTTYKYISLIIMFPIATTIHLAYKRLKMSRCLTLGMLIGILGFHMNLMALGKDDQFVLETLTAFFLMFYLFIASIYNMIRCVRYIGVF